MADVFELDEELDPQVEPSSSIQTERIVPGTPTSSISLTPPKNFSPVCGNIYRSSFPTIENFEFLKRINLKSVICLIPEDYPEENREFLEEQHIQFFQVGLSGNKEPFVKIKPQLIEQALKIVLNPENHPILIHCNRGKHRTGCLSGCIRKLQKWSLTMIFDEYRKFAAPKERALDQQFIEMFDDTEVEKMAIENKWLPIEW
ncbi:Tyrosine phosphatase [Komagataella phaffii CBS 7435]|uniref:diphosphoinositol-polyphosphate diphosphatase n=2 Tax=Komagataella phaffii TaxID=460519 RepID=C4R2J9_KOMPG|nr:Tyrosine phosphatase that plays a role in actin filament organization and endocytosis [Komagataella phaffii GS115]AOA62146.1 GQ67_01141T0 [Komagataella phaffii]KAI0462171.1 tyrosine-protein phosphatase siw14 [Komagataella kurtzmanii]CAH2447723.1 Tyrosine phosphatase [Komagataella phaffii CBS 7435]AOA67622.1 GQ68_00248T0 [Komagataella phaffii GS115]CAY69723.1 Tyrosine phosphatase that plays a role in actin filament organization and endocytosis [Komagataella phaffii GS115]